MPRVPQQSLFKSRRTPEGEPTRAIAIRPGDLKVITLMAAEGLRESSIARRLGTSPAGWTRLKQRDPRAAEAFERGRDQLQATLHATMLDPAIPDGMSVQQGIAVMNRKGTNYMFLLKALFGYRDGGEPQNQDASKLAVVINLPAPARSVVEYVNSAPAALAKLPGDSEKIDLPKAGISPLTAAIAVAAERLATDDPEAD